MMIFSMEKYQVQIKNISFVFLFSLASYVFVYGFELTHFTLSIDEEVIDSFAQTLSAGRWGHALLKHYLLPEPYLPFFTLLLSLILLSASSAFAALYLKLNRIHSIAFCIMLAALPQLAYQLQFSNQADTVALSMLCSVVSLFMLEKISASKATVFILLTIAALSIYQSIFFYAASLLCIGLTLSAIRGEINIRDSCKKIVLFSVLAGLSLVIDSFLSKIVAGHYGVQISGYLSAMIGWGTQDFAQVAEGVVAFIKTYMTGNAAYGMNSFSFSTAWLAAVILLTFFRRGNALLVSILATASFVSMFLLNFAIGAGMPPRAMTQAPLVFAGLYICLMVISRMGVISIVVASVFLVVGSSSSTRLFYSDYMAREADRGFSEQIVNSIFQKYSDFNPVKTPVFFYGSFSPSNTWRVPTADVFGASFFEWDGGNNDRMYKYLSIANIINLSPPSPEQVETARIKGAQLPSWPDRGAIALVDGVIIVKLSNKLSVYNR